MSEEKKELKEKDIEKVSGGPRPYHFYDAYCYDCQKNVDVYQKEDGDHCSRCDGTNLEKR